MLLLSCLAHAVEYFRVKVYACVCAPVCVHLCTWIHGCGHASVCMPMCVCVHVGSWICGCVHASVFVCLCVCVCVCVCVMHIVSYV